MTAGVIYTVDKDSLVRMNQGAPPSESHMQELVAKYPEIIGDTDGPLLLIKREQRIADTLESGGRWALDHLFVTRNAVPVLVELKRATDSRLRREVVGQLLDYAAHSVVYFKSGAIADAFMATCAAVGEDPDVKLQEFLNGTKIEDFWDRVDINLKAGNMKLVFVADQVPKELARVVEFLNDQMRADVQAVELSWYLNADRNITTLVPRVIGETQRTIDQKASARSYLPPIDIQAWIEKNIVPQGQDALKGASIFIEFVEDLNGKVIVSQAQSSLLGQFKNARGEIRYPLKLWDDGTVAVTFQHVLNCPVMTDEQARRTIYEQFVSAVGPLKGANLKGMPSFEGSLLSDPVKAAGVKTAMAQLIWAVRSPDVTESFPP